MQVTRPSTLIGLFALCVLASWLAVRETFAGLPLLPVTAIPALVALAIAETLVGRNVKGRLAKPGTGKPLAPIAVARLAALAKASSVTAAAIAGLVCGFLIYVLGELSKTEPARDAKVAGATVVAAGLLVVAALYLERCCRAPTPPDDDGEPDWRDSWQWHH